MLVRFEDDTDDAEISPVTNPGESNPQNSRQSGKVTRKDVENEDALFIPLGWSRLQKGELYTTSDPEWQEFVKLSKDRKKLQQLRGEILILSPSKSLAYNPKMNSPPLLLIARGAKFLKYLGVLFL